MNMASTGILCSIVFVILIRANAAFVKVQCMTESVGQYGQQSLLDCNVKHAEEVSDFKIRVVVWKKEGVDEPVLMFNKEEITSHPDFQFAEPSWNNRNMNVSLLITNTKVVDSGAYTCMVIGNTGDDMSDTNLKVTAKYKVPTISSIPEKITLNTGGSLICKSDGGYPKGEIRWFDEYNTDWTKSAKMEAKQTTSGLVQLSSELTLLQGSVFSKYICQVFNASGGKEAETTFNIPVTSEKHEGNGEEKDTLSSKAVAPLVVIGSLIVGLLIVLLVCKRRSRRSHQQVAKYEQDAEKGDRQGMNEDCQSGKI
ncbi:butyrophilin subfamily 2 member A2-like [Mastacembelus armatus]|uniref:Butyrophilin subfamily 2 member A2-like n=1 Tax=Mastacembelus armatus TaxID=205130 RepID=A0A7N8X4C8_9TELE|nr:butyrophilin subfamily 2 member A2-like [Mastacembelus armatus]